MSLQAKRIQWPIGQGNFSSGSIAAGQQRFEYVYDCGANNSFALRSACDALRPSQGIIDALFLSHLDSDHVNGVDKLATANGYVIKNLFLPYLTDLEAFLVLANELVNDSLTGDCVAFLENPVAWAADRGVSSVFFIGRSRDPEDPGKDEPEDRPDPRERRWRPLIPSEGSQGDQTRLEMYASCEVNGIVNSGEHGTSWASYPGKASFSVGRSGRPEWYLVPWVPPMPADRIKDFVNSLHTVGIKIPTGSFSRKNLLAVVKDKTLRKNLKACYELLSSNHNYVSMCLYSGPYKAEAEVHVSTGPGRRHHSEWISAGDKAGWLGTGDSPLKVARLYKSFREKYDRLLPCISTLMCPHHGSHLNFNLDLLTDIEPWMCFASHGSSGRPYGHPSDEVVRQIQMDSSFRSVTEEPWTRLVEHITVA